MLTAMQNDTKTAAEIGARGGQARAKSLSATKRSEIARAAAEKRWEKDGRLVARATHEGPLTIGNIEIECAVLEDGTRVMSRASFVRAMGRKGKVKGGQKYAKESGLPVFVAADNLKPFIPDDLESNSTPILYRTKNGVQAMGYRYMLLPLVCNVFLDAKEQGALLPNQEHIAQRCKILSRGFAVVGLAALIDEATGYQEVRDRQALQAILDKYLRKEFAAWAKRFPDEFYQHIFRMRGWQWKGMYVNGPRVLANYTKDIVYKRLTTGILEELERVNPKDDRGIRPTKHHQWLTEDVGHPALAQHIYAVMGLMRISQSWDEFKAHLDRAFPRKGATLSLPLD
jgi:hypothetical protein